MAQLTADNAPLRLNALAGSCFVPEPCRDVGNAGLSGGFRHRPLELDSETNVWGGLGSASTWPPLGGLAQAVRESRNVFQVYPDDLEITQG